MARFFAAIETDKTGLLQSPDFVMPEQRAQDIFAYLLESAAPKTRTNEKTGETYQDAATLGECLLDRINAFISEIELQAIAHKRTKAAREAAEALPDQPEITIKP